MPPPGVSVILPSFNRVKYLREAVDSVLTQTHTEWELVIADDGSEDETRAFLRQLKDPRITTMLLPHCGNPAAVRNAAIRQARGPYVAFLDSDDAWTPSKLEVQLGLMGSHRDRRWSYTRESRMDAIGNPLSEKCIQPWSPHEGWIVEPLLKLEALVSTPSVVAERGLIDEVGGFDEEQLYGEDYDLWLRLAMRSEVSVSLEPLVRVRAHIDNYSRDRVAAYQGWVRLYGKMAGMIPDSRLRSLCRRKRGENALILAGLYGDRGDIGALARTLLAASPYSWPYRAWWMGATKAMIRPIVPSWMRSAHRRPRQ